ncbi:hypothetical protein MHYP_G00117190 [Metynnis hypsauchen]
MMMERTGPAPANITNGTTLSSDHPWSFFVHNQPGVLLTIFGACLFGAVVRTLLSVLKLPYTVVLAMCGFLLETLSFYYPGVSYYTKEIANISPQLLLHTFMPVLIFSCAFEIESHAFWKCLIQVLILAVPGCLLSTCLTGVVVVKMFPNWSWYVGMMFGAIVSTLDPFVTASQLHRLGTAKPLILIAEGESLFADGTAFITFEVFKDLATHPSYNDASYFTVKLVLKVLGSPLIGFIMSKIVNFWLSHVFDDGLVEITISLVMTYISFYLAQWLDMSGVIAVLIMVLLLDTITFSPEIEVFLLQFWEMLTFLANTLIFFISGIVIAQAFHNMAFSDFLYILGLYCAVQAIRLVTVVLLSPLLSCCGYGFNYRWALVCVWGATKGAFCLSLTLMAYQAEGLDKLQVREKILVLSCGMVLLTLIINATTMNMFLKVIGMCDISEPKRMAMNTALLHMKKNAQSTFNMLIGDRFLANANWEMVEHQVHIDDPYRTPHNMVNIEEFSPSVRVTKCPDCDSSVPLVPSPRELDDMMEEARVRILTALKESYWKQYSSGMLNRKAARILNNTAEIMTDHKGKFMTVQDIKKYWEPQGFFVALQKKLEDWLYNVNIHKLSPPRNAVQKLCWQIVFSVPFEPVIYILILLNIFPIIIEFVPVTRDEYSQELHVVNYIFFSCYVAETVLKALAMRKAYILNPWNQFDLFIIVLAVVDIIINDFVASLEVQMFRIIRVSKMFRLTRALRLIKIIIPKLITLVEHQIHKQLSLGYEIGNGFVIGEEDISKIIDHISDDQTVSKKLKGILEMNRQLAVKEIGLLQRNYPEIAISVKTRQACRAVLNSQRETIGSLMLMGLLDEVESKKLKKMIEIRMKKLTKFPPTIPAPTAESLLPNLPWLHSDVAQIEFIKKVAKLMIFDLGDIIMRENDKPQGIHLIVSGVVKMTGSSPGYGGREQKEKSHVIDYQSSGTIIGELNCLTQQPLEFTVTCETATQTCFIGINSLFEAFDVFPEDPSLEYKMWLSLAIRIATTVFMENINYQGWTHHKMCSYLSNAYLMDVEVNGKVLLYDGSIQDVVVIYGSCSDVLDQRSYQAPALISKTTYQVLGTANITKLLIIPSTSAGVKDTKSEILIMDSALCRLHVAQQRDPNRESSGLETVRSEELFAEAEENMADQESGPSSHFHSTTPLHRFNSI